jgi:hypothetical protein
MIPLHLPLMQKAQHGTVSVALQLEPLILQHWAPALAPNVAGVKKAPAVINNAATSFNNKVFFIFFSPYKNKVEPE